MARYRSRSRSYSPRRRSRTPPRGRKRYEEEPRDRYHDSKSYRDRRSPAPSGLLVRNLPLDARPEDLRMCICRRIIILGCSPNSSKLQIPNHVAIKIVLELKKLLIDNSLLDVSQSDLEANLFKVCRMYNLTNLTKEMCLINKKNRGENKIVHTSGSKSFQQRNVEEVI
uniref:Uncharacterized protein n=1 Tax=Fagus sylvatica TaxID=28930 RepID=A0A2N9FSD5_FAGSY